MTLSSSSPSQPDAEGKSEREDLRIIFDAFALGDLPEALEERPEILGPDAAVVAQVADEQLGLTSLTQNL